MEYILYGTLRVRKAGRGEYVYYISLPRTAVEGLGLDKYIGRKVRLKIVPVNE